jgi:hypothetical protein
MPKIRSASLRRLVEGVSVLFPADVLWPQDSSPLDGIGDGRVEVRDGRSRVRCEPTQPVAQASIGEVPEVSSLLVIEGRPTLVCDLVPSLEQRPTAGVRSKLVRRRNVEKGGALPLPSTVQPVISEVHHSLLPLEAGQVGTQRLVVLICATAREKGDPPGDLEGLRLTLRFTPANIVSTAIAASKTFVAVSRLRNA